jgi:hypothetical protein
MHSRGDTLMYNFRGVYGSALTDATALRDAEERLRRILATLEQVVPA